MKRQIPLPLIAGRPIFIVPGIVADNLRGGHLLTIPARLPIEVRGQLTERDHLDALRVVRGRLHSRWPAAALLLGVPHLIVLGSLLAGMSLTHALMANVFWIVLGPLILFLGIPLATKQKVHSGTRGAGRMGGELPVPGVAGGHQGDCGAPE